MELNEYNPKTLKVLAYFVMITGPILFLFGLLLLIYYPILGLFCGCFSVFAIVQSNKWRKIANERINKPTITTYNHADDYPSDFVVFDFETSTFNPDLGEILQVGAIKYENCVPKYKFVSYCKPTRPIPKKASEVNHIYNDTVADAPEPEDVLERLVRFIGDYTLVAHNAPFDMKFLQTYLNYYGMPLVDNKVIDTLTISRNFLDLPNHKLETIKKHYKMNVVSHDSFADCKVCARLYIDYYNYINPEYDEITDDIYTCFIDGAGTNFSDKLRTSIEQACSDNGGRCYKTAAKSAKYAIIAADYYQNKDRVDHWHDKGYKVTTIEKLTNYLNLS